MKIFVDALIFQKDPHGGIARVFREILPRICSLDPEVQVVFFCDGPLQGPLPSHPQISTIHTPPVHIRLQVHGLWRKLLYPLRRIASRLWQRVRSLWIPQERAGIWHATFFTLPPAWDGPQVVTIYDMIPERYPHLFQDPLDKVASQLKKQCVQQADGLICISKTSQEDITRFYGPVQAENRVIYLASSPVFRPLAANERAFSPVPGPFLLYVGRRAHYKNFYGLIDAYRDWEGRTSTRLVVVGVDWTAAEKDWLVSLDLLDDIILMTQVDDEALCQLYNQAGALVFPSQYEGFGIPILEALSCGCPVVASRIPSSLEVGGDCPFYFDLDQPETLRQAFDQALADGRTPQRVQAGLAQAGRFSWDRAAKETLALYRDVCHRYNQNTRPDCR
jgi:glycosyltransferase involved in cell wall biosynthesis